MLGGGGLEETQMFDRNKKYKKRFSDCSYPSKMVLVKNKYDFQNLHDRDLVIWMIRNMSRTPLLGIIKTIFISI